MTGFSYSKRERENIYKDIVSWNGTKKQLIVAVEKMSELCVEICKYINEDFNPDILSDIAEKTAAVVIMIEQIQLILKLEAEIIKYMNFKLDRMLVNMDDTSYLYLKDGDD